MKVGHHHPDHRRLDSADRWLGKRADLDADRHHHHPHRGGLTGLERNFPGPDFAPMDVLRQSGAALSRPA